MTVSEAFEQMHKSGCQCTLQAVYKEFRSLIADNIVQKIGKTYMLNASWVLELQKFSNQLVKSVFGERAGPFLLASQGKKQIWTFNSLLELNDFWAHLDLYLVKISENKNIMTWNPYLWFFLFHTKTEEKFFKSIKMLGAQFVVIVGGNNFLNRIGGEFYHRNDVIYSYNPEPFQTKMDMYLNIIGDYVVSVKLAKNVYQKMDDLYRSTKSMATISIPDITELFMKEGKSKLTLEYNPQKAGQLRRKFSRHFGEEF